MGATLAAGLLVVGQPAALAGNPDFGRVWRGDGTLRAGCHNYKYQYKVKPPKPDWALETFLVDPTKETIASGAFISGNDPKRGTGKFRFCRYNTEPGTFKIRGKLTYREGYDQWVRWVKPGYFKLTRR
jgi:hypothetical protein